eukprot:TRINITY_DN19560_c0_g1_i2.p3 TRINITY_DN19560_c0_g1~~TRINITY_DN19560_c0_g1_i2.p3  ORF type:complete len:255 (+),score=38.00 TRINITY_DN19560_c0_g1_i2:448-1212(+)
MKQKCGWALQAWIDEMAVEMKALDPEVFLMTAERLGVDPGNCLVFEDAPNGIKASCVAGMQVVAVPFLSAKQEFQQFEDLLILSSLLDFRPELFGLPEFTDYVSQSVPLIPVWKIKGKVVEGFGRGSKQLGIPTANLDRESVQQQLNVAVTGIYYGWASVGQFGQVYKMVMSVGWNPFFQNQQKTVEPWILHKFEGEFYGEEIRLVVCGYIRPECNFESLEALMARIHNDADIAKEALDHQTLISHKQDQFLEA